MNERMRLSMADRTSQRRLRFDSSEDGRIAAEVVDAPAVTAEACVAAALSS